MEHHPSCKPGDMTKVMLCSQCGGSDPITPEIVRTCPDCGAAPGAVQSSNCDVERCSVCGAQRLGCNCPGHDRRFARWTGFWPAAAESDALGIDLNEFHSRGLYKALFIKPTGRMPL